MKKTYLFSVLLMLFSLTSCWDNEYQEDFEAIKAKATGVDGESGACPVGKWSMPTCNGAPGKNLIYYFGSDGTGYSENPDCNEICTPMRFNFRYTVSGDKISYTFTSTEDVICSGVNQGRPNTPSGSHTLTYSCLNGGSEMQAEYVNIQTGAKSVYNFKRM
ncbi:hypothetical protein [Adhaeribacter terreus]|uniref:Lipocalin-like domain-containing protein n=1 Tax=Adhaeribacter terreus TaxID=529703 RepID=A0ABW0E841_9BACT